MNRLGYSEGENISMGKNRNNIALRLFFILLMLLALTISLWMTADIHNLESNIYVVTTLAILIIGFILYSTYNYTKRLDCYMIFMSLSFIFMFGQHLLLLMQMPVENMWLTGRTISNKAIVNTSYFTIVVYILMHMGYIVSIERRPRMLNLPNPMRAKQSRGSLMHMGLIVFCVVLLPTLYIMYRNMITTFVLGYAARLEEYQESGVSNLPSILAGYMTPALVAMFVAKQKKTIWPIVLIAIYLVLYVLSGSRLGAFCLLCGVFYANFVIHANFNKKTVVFMLIAAFFLAFVFSFISHWRDSELGSENIITTLWKNNPVTEILNETGYTFMATAAVFEHCPSSEPFLYGKSYWSGIAYILPNGMTDGYYLKTPDVDRVFSPYITNYGGIGSSFIAEAFYNFGYLSLPLFLIFGFLFGILSLKIENSVLRENYPKIFFYIGIFCVIIFYVRSDTRTFFRNFMWEYVPMYLYCKITDNIHAKRQKLLLHK